MNMFPNTDALQPPEESDIGQPINRFSHSGRLQPRVTTRTRMYEVAYLSAEGQIVEFSRKAPALASFEDAFGAVGHGAILQTNNGPMAVEDLLPGDEIRLSNGRYEKLLWSGSITISPVDHDANPDHGSLTRITADALGLNRPSPDLVLGPTARLLHRAAGVRTLTGKAAAFVPARDFFDGNGLLSFLIDILYRLFFFFSEFSRSNETLSFAFVFSLS